MSSRRPPYCCHACGLSGDDNRLLFCARCNQVAYCSKECQVYDWREAGHKLVCCCNVATPKDKKQTFKLHDILRELFRADLRFLQSDLTQLEESSLCLFLDEPSGHRNHFFRAGEIALCLVGANPCAAVGWFQLPNRPIGKKYYQKVVLPWYKKYKRFLNRIGFEIEFLDYPVQVSDLKCKCGSWACREYVDLGHLTLVKNTKHPMVDMVNKIFIQRARDEIKMADFLACAHGLVYTPPEMSEGTVADTGNDGWAIHVTYLFDMNSEVIFGRDSEEVCCTPCLRLGAVHSSDASALGRHFRKCYDRMKAFGFNIGIFVPGGDAWSDEAIALFLIGAARGDMNEVLFFMETAVVFTFTDDLEANVIPAHENEILGMVVKRLFMKKKSSWAWS